MSMNSPDLVLLQKMRDAKDIRQTEHPIDKLKLLKGFAERDYKPNTENLIETLLTIIDRLHTRLCNLEEELTRRS